MSEHDPQACGTDAAAYALGALSEIEASAFEAHLGDCVVCRDELAAFQQIVGVLPLAAEPIPAPSRLRRRVIDQVNAEASLDPRRRLATPTRAPRRRFMLTRPAIALASAAVIALAATGGIDIFSGGAHTKVYGAQVIGSAGTAQLRVTGGRADLVVDHLARPKPGSIYEVWLQRGKTKVPAKALFSVSAGGAADVDVPGSLKGVSHVLVTEEPGPSGTSSPSTPAVVDASL